MPNFVSGSLAHGNIAPYKKLRKFSPLTTQRIVKLPIEGHLEVFPTSQ